ERCAPLEANFAEIALVLRDRDELWRPLGGANPNLGTPVASQHQFERAVGTRGPRLVHQIGAIVGDRVDDRARHGVPVGVDHPAGYFATARQDELLKLFANLVVARVPAPGAAVGMSLGRGTYPKAKRSVPQFGPRRQIEFVTPLGVRR